MYTPKEFKQDNGDLIFELIDLFPLGLLITTSESKVSLSHLPFLFEREYAQNGRLLGHFAKANPQWRELEDIDEAIVVFSGPNSYVSPSWYHLESVPTWNYSVVHIYGKPTIIHDRGEKREVLDKLTDRHESSSIEPWRSDFDSPIQSKMLEAVVAFEIVVTKVEAKFKLSQNKDEIDQLNVINHLAASPSTRSQETSLLMKRALPSSVPE